MKVGAFAHVETWQPPSCPARRPVGEHLQVYRGVGTGSAKESPDLGTWMARHASCPAVPVLAARCVLAVLTSVQLFRRDSWRGLGF
jgi:hypothetical protein